MPRDGVLPMSKLAKASGVVVLAIGLSAKVSAQPQSIDLSENIQGTFIAGIDGNLYQKIDPSDYLAGSSVDPAPFGWCIYPWGCWFAEERRLVSIAPGEGFELFKRGPVMPGASGPEILVVPTLPNFGLGDDGSGPLTVPSPSDLPSLNFE